MYHEHEEYLWTAEEIGSSQDTADCDTLTVNEQFSVKHVLAWAHFPGEPHSSRAHRIGKNLILLLSWILVAGSYRSNILKLGKFTKSVEQPSGLPMVRFVSGYDVSASISSSLGNLHRHGTAFWTAVKIDFVSGYNWETLTENELYFIKRALSIRCVSWRLWSRYENARACSSRLPYLPDHYEKYPF